MKHAKIKVLFEIFKSYVQKFKRTKIKVLLKILHSQKSMLKIKSAKIKCFLRFSIAKKLS
jgi:hypothetical protein